MTPMNIRYNKALSIFVLAAGALILFTVLVTGQATNAFGGGVLLLLGILLLVNPMLRIEPTEIQVRSPIGMTMKRFPISSPGDLRFEGNKLHHLPRGKKIAGLGFGADSGDVAALRSQLPG